MTLSKSSSSEDATERPLLPRPFLLPLLFFSNGSQSGSSSLRSCALRASSSESTSIV
eukprot:CAMPEP_0202416326 /NCGR_PEP_ID=MMETSP1128-20130828/39231_1 /ASSEMBLY_ACC=CAM_ASM_000463 /TAXON_ID=3047 /ORGANISM="Dunaliella tertiolecta, Strain CCMP1320" /LENGTH=56 /DNA_ID=CAMNT_0049023287 /DNA_START=248 /DNA_END=414 /DNA_ORIENTATION=+